LRAEPFAILDARAKFRESAPDIERPDSARAALLRTADTEARAPDTEGENEPLDPEPDTAAAVLLALAEPVDWLDVPAGLLRAEPLAAFAALAIEREEAPDIARPASARAPLLLTPDTDARDPDTEGENEPLAPDPDTAADSLRALADALGRLMDPPGLFLAVPCALVDACAMAWLEAPDMD